MAGASGARGDLVGDLRTFARYARRLPGFLRSPISLEEARRRIERQLREREDTFLRILGEGIYANPDSPYPALLRAVGAERGDVEWMVRDDGVEAALGQLRDAGLYVSIDEFKGNRPIERPGLSIPADDRRFENPMTPGHLITSTGGSSRGRPRRVSVDLDLLEYDIGFHALFDLAYGLEERPLALWRVVPPSASGVNNAFRQIKLGRPLAHWFNPHRPGRDPESIKFGAYTRATLLLARVAGRPIPAPDYCPPEDAARVARWLAARRAEGRPAVLDTQVGLGVRVCLAARDEDIDISGTFFRFGGEPFTDAREQIVHAAGCTAVCHYTMAETGRIGIACGNPAARDDVHFLSDKLAVLQRERSVGTNGATVHAFAFTTLLTSASKLMINVESGDAGTIVKRSCGCPLGEVGLSTHMHGVHSYDKLTAEGNHFVGLDLLELVDTVLPARFGGDATDYQLVEDEVGGLPKVTVVVRPSVGHVDERAVVHAVIEHLRSQQHNRLMAEVWREGDTLRVERREPYVSGPGAKILPLKVRRERVSA